MKEQFRKNIHEENSDIKAEIQKNQLNLPYNMDLLSILNDAVIITDENFKITYWNPAATEVYSWEYSEVVGKKVKDVLKTRFIDIEEPKTVQKLVKTGSYEDEVIQFTKKNFPLYISTKIVAIKDVNNVINGYIYINRDMTVIKNTEKKLKRNYNILNSIIENTTDAVYLKNLSGNYIMANTTHSEIVGKPVSEIIGKNDWELFPSRDADVITRDDKEIIENIKTVTYEETLYSHREGAVRNYITTKGPYRGYDDTILGIFGIGRDITHLKSAERKIVENELKETMQQLKISNSELEEFTYIASHDLKEPLRMISSFLQLLQRRYHDKLDEDANEFIDLAVDGAIQLHELLDDLLVYSRLNSNSTELTEVDIGEVVEIVKFNLDILINENDANITSDNLPVTMADKTQMIQLFQNLISNSIKYRGKENPVIHISAEKDGNKWLFAVEDNGIGIQPEYSEKIFKIFQKLHGPQKYDGTGIGLSISKRIVEKHGGNIWIDTDRINGTKFNFSLRSG